jgi:hypothetical protein
VNKTSITLLAAFAVSALAPSLALAQNGQPAHSTAKVVIKKGPTVKKTTIRTGAAARHKVVTCHYTVRNHKKVKVCK